MGKAQATIEISASSSKLAAGLNEARYRFQSWSASIARSVGGAFKGISAKIEPGKIAKHAAGDMLGNLGSKGIGALFDAAGEVRDFEKNLIRYQIATDGSAASTAAFREKIRAISRDTTISAADVLAGAQAYVGFTGDAKGAADAAKLFADVSVATGSSVADVAQAMSSLKSSMGITAAEGEAAFSALIVQGKGGAVEIKDQAAELAALTPQFARFKGGQGLGALREMGAGFQVVMKNAATASDAATKYSALMGSLSDAATLKEMKKIGLQVTDNKGKLLDASTVFENIAKNQKLFEGTNLSKVFGRKEAQLAALALKEHIGLYRNLRDAASDTGAVQRDKMTMLNSDAGKIDKAFNEIKLTFAELFTPERIKAFASALQEVVQGLSKMLKVGSMVIETVINPLKSWEDHQETKRKNELTDARRKAIKADLLKGGASELEAEKGSWAGIGLENQMVARVKAQGQGLDWTADPSKYGDAGGRKSVFSAAELQAMSVQGFKAGTTNAMDLFTASMAEAVRQGMAESKAAEAPKVELKVGDNAVAAATANATKPRRGVR